MSDWADKKADKIMDACWDRDTNIQSCLAEAFRQHRAEVLEEAAKVAETCFVRWPMDGAEQRASCAAAIRALANPSAS